MSEPMWGQRPPPHAGHSKAATVWDGRPCTLADVTELRLRLREGLTVDTRPHGMDDGDIERLLLVFEELTSNGLRHGRAPVQVVVTTTDSGWLIDVSDAAADTPPVLAVGRDAAHGGLGLHLVARLSAAHGWAVDNGRKHVWARVDSAAHTAQIPASPLPMPRGGNGRTQLH